MKNNVRFEYVSRKNVWFCFVSIVWVYFSHISEKFRFWKSFKHFNIFWEKNMWPQICICSMEKCFDFVSFLLLGFTLVIIKLRNLDFEIQWNTLIFLIKKYMTFRFEYFSHGKMSDFVWFPLFWFTLVIKLRNFDFESHWNIW